MIALSAEDLSFAPRGAREILHGIFLKAVPGQVLGVLGPNGAGKSSLLRLFYGAVRPSRGVARIDGHDAAHLPSRRRARLVAAVPQESPPDFHLTVQDVVETGRTPYVSALFGRDADGPGAVTRALDRLGLSQLAAREFTTLSGGEKKRTLIARALAQGTPALVLDEPVNHLDIRHKLQVMSLLRELETTVIVSLHDFDLAARFCDRLAVLDHGRLVAQGVPAEILTPGTIRQVFGVDATIARDRLDGELRITAIPLARGAHDDCKHRTDVAR